MEEARLIEKEGGPGVENDDLGRGHGSLVVGEVEFGVVEKGVI